LSGWPSVTDSEVNRRRDNSVAPHAAAADVFKAPDTGRCQGLAEV